MPMPEYVRPESLRIPVQLRANLRPPTYLKTPCGYCSVPNFGGKHDGCKRAIRAGDGHIMLCPCSDPMQHPEGPAINTVFCTQCENTQLDELDEKLYLCWDKEECDARVRTRLKKTPSHQLIHQAYLDADATRARDKETRPRVRNPNRPSSGKCLCCGEPTAGGLFLPGHDARLVSQAAARVASGAPAQMVLEEFKSLGVSDKLYAKLERKLERE